MIGSWKDKFTFWGQPVKKTAAIVDSGYFAKFYVRTYGNFPPGAAAWSYVKKLNAYLTSKLSSVGVPSLPTAKHMVCWFYVLAGVGCAIINSSL